MGAMSDTVYDKAIGGAKAKTKGRRRGATGPKTAQQIETHEKRIKALELRKAGFSYREIAKQVGWADPKSARIGVEVMLREYVPQDVVDDVRKLECERLDALWRPQYRAAIQGDRLAVDRCLHIMERRAALLGLDAPIRIQQQVITEDDLETAIEKFNREAEALEARAWQAGSTPPPALPE
jgi:hypothetical protein